MSHTHTVNTAPATKICTKRCQFSHRDCQKCCTYQANQTRRGDSKVSAKQRAFCKTGKGICILCCNSGSRPCELGANKQSFRMSLAAGFKAGFEAAYRNCNKTKNARLETYRSTTSRSRLRTQTESIRGHLSILRQALYLRDEIAFFGLSSKFSNGVDDFFGGRSILYWEFKRNMNISIFVWVAPKDLEQSVAILAQVFGSSYQ